MMKLPERSLVTQGFEIRKHRYYISKFRRAWLADKTNSPYLSGDVFASIVEFDPYARGQTNAIKLEQLEKARSLFVRSSRLEEFLGEFGDRINATVLITGNSDTNLVVPPALPDSVQLWLAQNISFEHPRVRTLPIGIENLSLGERGLPRYFRPQKSHPVAKSVLVPPMSATNPIRPRTVRLALERPDVFEVKTDYLPTAQYFRFVRNYRFVLCLEGNGSDTHRVWETLYFGNFPVLLSTAWSRSLKYLGLPLLLVDTIADISPELLEDFAETHRTFDPAQAEPLWIPYWREMIEAHSMVQ